MFSVEDILRENVFFFGVWLYFLKCFKTHYMVFCMMKKKKKKKIHISQRTRSTFQLAKSIEMEKQ